MSFSVTIFGPGHHFWRQGLRPRVWAYRPDQHSSGGTGFKIPFLHVVFLWGMR